METLGSNFSENNFAYGDTNNKIFLYQGPVINFLDI